MGQCDAILRQGVFDTIIIDFNKSVASNLFEWLKNTDFQTFKEKTSGGLNIGLPIEGIPINIGINFSEDEFNEWKQSVNQGQVRNFTEDEALQIVRRSASPDILDAWVKCIRDTNNNGTGIICRLLSDEDAATIQYEARFIPNSSADADKIPQVNRFIVTGATSIEGIQVGDEIPFGGVAATITREGRSEITINLNTDKGICTRTIPPIPLPAPPPPPIVNIEGTYRSLQSNNRYLFEQDGRSVTVTEIEPNDRVIASAAGQIQGRTVILTYQSFIDNETGTARITLSRNGERVTGTYTRADTGETFALDWIRI